MNQNLFFNDDMSKGKSLLNICLKYYDIFEILTRNFQSTLFIDRYIVFVVSIYYLFTGTCFLSVQFLLPVLFINKTLRLNNLKTRTAINAKTSVYIICVEAIVYFLLCNLHVCTFKMNISTKEKRSLETLRYKQKYVIQ